MLEKYIEFRAPIFRYLRKKVNFRPLCHPDIEFRPPPPPPPPPFSATIYRLTISVFKSTCCLTFALLLQNQAIETSNMFLFISCHFRWNVMANNWRIKLCSTNYNSFVYVDISRQVSADSVCVFAGRIWWDVLKPGRIFLNFRLSGRLNKISKT